MKACASALSTWGLVGLSSVRHTLAGPLVLYDGQERSCQKDMRMVLQSTHGASLL